MKNDHAHPRNYFVYVPDSPLCAAWGCAAISAGYTDIAPGSSYPPARHPDDHHFDWRRGRILRDYQIVYISHGAGTLEFGARRERAHLRAGDLFVLFPNVWHRYAPRPETGWVEHWVECRGAAFDFMRDSGRLAPQSPVYNDIAGAQAVFARIHACARQDMLASQPLVSTLGLELLAAMCQRETPRAGGSARTVDRAKMILLERCTKAPRFETIAAELGVSYSHLRRIFKAETGVSLKSYALSARLQRAADLLVNTDKSVKEIAGLLGFSSAFHFSAQFSAAYAVSPTTWRAAQR